MADSRAERLYCVLAAHPDGLPTRRIYEASCEHIAPRPRALPKYGGALRRHECRGWVRRVGRTPGGRRHGSWAIWQLAPGTCREVFAARPASCERAAAARRELEVEGARALAALEAARDAGYGRLARGGGEAR
jgi:hypothetical protein